MYLTEEEAHPVSASTDQKMGVVTYKGRIPVSWRPGGCQITARPMPAFSAIDAGKAAAKPTGRAWPMRQAAVHPPRRPQKTLLPTSR